MSERREAIGPEASRSGRRGASERRIRFTLDLPRNQHRFLKQFALDAEADASVVLRTLLDLLEKDDGLADNLRRRIRPR